MSHLLDNINIEVYNNDIQKEEKEEIPNNFIDSMLYFLNICDKYYKNVDLSKLSDKDKQKLIISKYQYKINLCKEFYELNKRLPKNKELYKDFNIGNFIEGIKEGHNKELKSIIEEIFNINLNK